MNMNKYPRTKKLIEETGMSLNQAYEFTEELEKRKYKSRSEFKSKDDYEDYVNSLSFEELLAECKRRGIL